MPAWLDITLTAPLMAEPPTPGAHVPLEFERQYGANRARCFAALRDGVKVRLRPSGVESGVCDAHADGKAVRLRVVESLGGRARTRVEMHLEIDTPWARESPSNATPSDASRHTVEFALTASRPVLQRLSERVAWWATLDSDPERRALRQGLVDVQRMVNEWLAGLREDKKGPQPRLLDAQDPVYLPLLAALQEELVDTIAKGPAPLGSRLRGRRRGLREGLHIITDTLGVDAFGSPSEQA